VARYQERGRGRWTGHEPIRMLMYVRKTSKAPLVSGWPDRSSWAGSGLGLHGSGWVGPSRSVLFIFLLIYVFIYYLS
jgi:hypothetical protein